MTERFVEGNNKDNMDDLQRVCVNLASVDAIHFKWNCQSKEIHILVINTASITDSSLSTVYKKWHNYLTQLTCISSEKIDVVACIEFTDL